MLNVEACFCTSRERCWTLSFQHDQTRCSESRQLQIRKYTVSRIATVSRKPQYYNVNWTSRNQTAITREGKSTTVIIFPCGWLTWFVDKLSTVRYTSVSHVQVGGATSARPGKTTENVSCPVGSGQSKQSWLLDFESSVQHGGCKVQTAVENLK